MTYKTVSSIIPVSAANPDCPFDCVDCIYFAGVEINGKDIDILCELENND